MLTKCRFSRHLSNPPPSQPCLQGVASGLCLTLLIVDADAAVSVEPTSDQP